MGSSKKCADVQLVTDYTTKESCIRLHLDVKFPSKNLSQVRSLLDEGNYPEAMLLIRQLSQDDPKEFLDMFFGPLIKNEVVC